MPMCRAVYLEGYLSCKGHPEESRVVIPLWTPQPQETELRGGAHITSGSGDQGGFCTSGTGGYCQRFRSPPEEQMHRIFFTATHPGIRWMEEGQSVLESSKSKLLCVATGVLGLGPSPAIPTDAIFPEANTPLKSALV